MCMQMLDSAVRRTRNGQIDSRGEWGAYKGRAREEIFFFHFGDDESSLLYSHTGFSCPASIHCYRDDLHYSL